MSRDGFDHSYVWTAGLYRRRVVVHEKPGWDERVREVFGATGDLVREDRRVRCGSDVHHRLHYTPGCEYPTDSDNFGVNLLAGHALAMGAHFCRRCWPDGYPGARS